MSARIKQITGSDYQAMTDAALQAQLSDLYYEGTMRINNAKMNE